MKFIQFDRQAGWLRTRWKPAAATFALLLLVAVLVLALAPGRHRIAYGPRPAGERPELLLLTSLPIVFPEGFNLDAKASPVLEALQTRYRVVPIGLADRDSLRGHQLLLMIQPRAQPAEVLVQLDQWVRGGGRVVLLADPALQWPSERALGDPIRPPPGFADTGLLGHWGLRLDAPDVLGPASAKAQGLDISSASPGRLVSTSSTCRTIGSGLVARCRIGTGEAIVVADADFIDVQRFDPANLKLLFAELASLED